jgi:iron complex transport system ATP-binding protein
VYRIAHLTFAYDQRPALKDVSAAIAAGDFVALIGPNGAGKSTLLKVLGGLLRSYAGTAEFNGSALARIPSRDLARRVAFVPQETRQMFPFTVSQMVLMGRLPHQGNAMFDSTADVEQAEAAMKATGVLQLANTPFNHLSGGERQRAVLASALAQTPEVLLLDEPTAFLDLKHQIHFYEIVERLNKEQKLTIVSVTHDLNLAARYARRMIALRDGMVVADGPPEAVLTPEHIHDIFEISAAVLPRPDGLGSFFVPTR